MNIPCSTPASQCASGTDADDALIANASAETPDVRKFFSYRYALRSSSFCEATTQVAADLCALNPPDPFNDPVIFSSSEQTCTIDCSGSPVAYTVPSGSALGLTQAEADATAYALACVGASIVCGGGSGTLIPNEAQACSVTCADGTVSTSIVPAGALSAFSLAEANAAAYNIACQAAALACPNIPPPSFGNSATSSTSDCPEGGDFTFNVAANTFFATTLAEANAAAQSYADQQAVLQRICLSAIQSAICASEEYFYAISAGSEPSSNFTWSITAGSLPPSYTFTDGFVSGNTSVAGVYSFTVRAVQNSTGNISTRTYTIGVMEITTSSPLTSGSVGAAYSLALSYTGVPSTAVFSLAYGTTPPPGLSLSSAGVISGTPTTVGTTAFSVIIADATSGYTCVKDFSMSVVLNPLDWWQMDEAGNGNRIGSVNGISLPCSSGASSVAGGKYGNATALNSQGTPANIDCSSGNTSAPVSGLAYAGNGIDAFIWIDNPAGLINSDTILLLQFTDAGGTPVWAMRFTIDNQVGIEYDMTGGASGNIPLATSSAYRFFELYYDPSLTRLGLRINDGAVMDQWITVAAPAVTAKGSISITYDRRTAGTSAANVCEMAVYPQILNSTQRAFLYGGGAGVTWPVVLP